MELNSPTIHVSVVVPLYNKARSVERTIRSILNQTYSNFELLIIDDGSTDGGPNIVESIQDNRIRLIRQDNAGPGAARNRGISESRGELIAFLDADDEWLPVYLQESIRRLAVAGPDAAATVSGYIESPVNISREGMWRARGLINEQFRVTPSTPLSKLIAAIAYMSPCSTVFRRGVIIELGGFLEAGCRYGEDAFLMVKLLFNYKVVIDLSPLLIYHKEDSALSANYKGPRPIEPFLQDPIPVLTACPIELRPILGRALGARALKTACVYGYWSRSDVSRTLLIKFWRALPISNRYFLPALISATPLGALGGVCARAALRWRRQAK